MKQIFTLIHLILVIPVGICGMIYGWGLEPQNWWWIIGSYAYAILGGGMFGAMAVMIEH